MGSKDYGPSHGERESREREVAADYADDDDDDDHNDEEEDAIVPSMRTSLHIAELEERLAQHQSELSRLRQERGKQRMELHQQVQAHERLQIQKDSRLERIKLQEQIQELHDIKEAKLLLKQMASEELDRTMTLYRRLQKTLKLLQGGIEYILEQSTNDSACFSTTDSAGRIRANERQALLMEILEENRDKTILLDSDDEEVEEIELKAEYIRNEDGNRRMFFTKQQSFASIDSMMSEIASIDPRDMILPPSHSRKPSVQRVARDLTAFSSIVHPQERSSRSRSSFPSVVEDNTQQESRGRSRSLSDHRSGQSTSSKTNNSISSGRRRRGSLGDSQGRKRRGGGGGEEEERKPVGRSRSMSSSPDIMSSRPANAEGGGQLRAMLESFEREHNRDAEIASHDTPRTTNTPGGPR